MITYFMEEVADTKLQVAKVTLPHFPVSISPCTGQELFADLACAARQKHKIFVDNVNIDNLWNAHQHREYCDVLNHLTTINLVDGMPVRWLSSIAGVTVPERLAFTDVVPQVMAWATRENLKLFIVGSNPETISIASQKLAAQNALPTIVGAWSEPRKALGNPEVNDQVLSLIEAAKPDIIMVAMGAPFQTLWISQNWDRFPDAIILSVGGAFDYMAGVVGRAPVWMQKSGLEWIYRLLFDRQPRERTLFQRYILTDLPFALTLAYKMKTRRVREHSV